jgi:hypothetical protein
VVTVERGSWSTRWILVAFWLLLPTLSLAQAVNVTYHWSPSPLVDDQGRHAAAVKYVVSQERDGGVPEMATTVTDTHCVLRLETGVRYRIRVAGIDADDRQGPWSQWSPVVTINAPGTGETAPLGPGLRPTYPNPFNPETTIVYGVPESVSGGSAISLEIYDIHGRRVRTLPVNRQPGWYEIQWSGLDDAGQRVPSGQYIVRFCCDGQSRTTKMTIVK